MYILDNQRIRKTNKLPPYSSMQFYTKYIGQGQGNFAGNLQG